MVSEPSRLAFGVLPRSDKHGFDQLFFRNFLIQKIANFGDPRLSIAAIDPAGTKAAYCSLWYDSRTDYAYLEPLCTVPAFRGKGLARAVVYEALDRVKALGAKTVYVISDLPFYEKIGFTKDRHYTFYWNK